jgi:hypothetical protein
MVLATPVLVYWYIGGGVRGFAIALAYMGCTAIYMFNVKWPEYTDGAGHFFFVASLLAMSQNHWSALILVACAVATREALGAALGIVAVASGQWWLLLPIGVAGAAAWLFRPEDPDLRHPLTADNYRDTIRWWIYKKCKGVAVYHWATCVQPLRGWPLVVPFMWYHATPFEQVALLAYLPLWLFSIPASGVSRHMAYGFILVAPFVAELPIAWLWVAVLLMWFWPRDVQVYDESGGIFGGLRKTEAACKRDGEGPSPDQAAKDLALWKYPGGRDAIQRPQRPEPTGSRAADAFLQKEAMGGGIQRSLRANGK